MNVTPGNIGTTGIQMGSRLGGTTYFDRFTNASGMQTYSTAGTLTGTNTDYNTRYMYASAGPSHCSNQQAGFLFANGMDTATRTALATALLTLWEACTGLSLP